MPLTSKNHPQYTSKEDILSSNIHTIN